MYYFFILKDLFSSLLVRPNHHNFYYYFKMGNSSGTYEGEWKNGKWHGIGVYQFSDGRVYQGHFENGNRCGHGI